eukprot:jgi/Tetstr1/455930/TSEL_042711.t1
MDNTVRENKNRDAAALCKWLVSIGSSAYTVEAILDLVAKAFSPTPEIAQLTFSLDISGWLRLHFQDHIHDISKPHKFEFKRDDAAASGGSLRTALWSNTPLFEPVEILKSAPTGTPEIPFSGFWPQRKEEVDNFLREHGQTAPAEARHSMATNADLDNAEAARVEAEVRAQVLQDDNTFRGVHAGATERLYDNTSPSDAKGLNPVVIDVSDATHDASGSGEVFNEDGTMIRKKWYAQDKAVRSDVFDDCSPRDTQRGIPCYPSEEDAEVSHIVAPPYIERICYATFNYRAGYTTAKYIYAKETVIAAIREYTPSPSSQPHCDHPNLWVVLTVHLMMPMKHGNVRNYLARYNFQDKGKDGQVGKCPPSNVTFKGKEEVCEVTPHSSSEAAVHTFGGKPIVSSVQRTKVVSLPLAGTAASAKLPGLFAGVPARQKKRAGGIIKNNNNAVKKAANASAATQTVPATTSTRAVARSPRPRRPSSPPSQRLECRPGAGLVPGPGRAVGRSGRGPAARPP